MSEFTLDYGSPEAARDLAALDEFTRGYIEAMFFTSTGPDDVEHGLEYASVDELAPDTWNKIVTDCRLFQKHNHKTLDLAYDGDASRPRPYRLEDGLAPGATPYEHVRSRPPEGAKHRNRHPRVPVQCQSGAEADADTKFAGLRASDPGTSRLRRVCEVCL